ncbi:hypothetical protein I4F81_001671 [Pyropia yezoensis]|uniref:Uncharacterized protein n=1 Tax=Pyropia yezoensis TaxID=2788 RepID=A0ACC3BME1_PYRYE|nr:hypothetical protein I4F81_001671 [Neopyropia yezoensis]
MRQKWTRPSVFPHTSRPPEMDATAVGAGGHGSTSKRSGSARKSTTAPTHPTTATKTTPSATRAPPPLGACHDPPRPQPPPTWLSTLAGGTTQRAGPSCVVTAAPRWGSHTDTAPSREPATRTVPEPQAALSMAAMHSTSVVWPARTAVWVPAVASQTVNAPEKVPATTRAPLPLGGVSTLAAHAIEPALPQKYRLASPFVQIPHP